MGFRLGSFLAGMAEGAIEIEEDVRKRNEKLFDATFETNAERRMKEYENRKAKQQEMDLLAKKLMSYEGMDANKVNLVLDYGAEEAKAFIDNAPKVAAQKKMSVGDLIDLKDPEAQSVDPYKFIRKGDLIEIPEYTPFARPGGLRKGIFTRDYGERFDAENAAFIKGLGLPVEEEGERIAAPEGSIKYMDMLTKERPEIASFTPNQVRNYLGEQIADALNVNATYKMVDGVEKIVFDSEDVETTRKARQLTTRAFGAYNQSLREGLYDVDYDQDLAIDYAFQTALDNVPLPNRAEVKTKSGETFGGGQEPVDNGSVPEVPEPSAVSEQPLDSITSPALLAQRIYQDAINSGKTMTPQEANALAKQMLDERKAAQK